MSGDIIHIPHGRSRGYAIVITRAESNADPRIGILTEDNQQRTASARDFTGLIEPVSYIKIPKKITLKTPKERRDAVSRMRQALIDERPPRKLGNTPIATRHNDAQEKLDTLRTQLRNHPCHGCSDRETHARWAERWRKLNAETEGLRRQITRRTNTIAQVFNRIAKLLTEYGYVTADSHNGLKLTTKGKPCANSTGKKTFSPLFVSKKASSQIWILRL